jgi:MYXO-CTERM domain-containing protein
VRGLAILGLLCGCSGAPDPTRLNFAGDTRASPIWQAEHPRPQFTGDVLWVNFAGALVSQAASDNAPADQSQIAGTQIPPFNAAVGAPQVSAADAQEAVFDRLKGYYLPYDLTLTTTQPTGSYSMILVGGNHALVGEPNGVAGVSPLDCTNANATNVVYAFSDDLTPLYGGVVALAVTAAHEAGHSYGLEHTDNPADIMFSVDPSSPSWSSYDIFHLSFTTSANFSGFNGGSTEPIAESCGRANPLDNDQILKTNLGASTGGDRTAPTLDWTLPPASAKGVPLSFLLAFSASDDVGVKKIEIYKEENQVGIQLIQVLRQSPYGVTLTATEGETFALVADAVDDAGNRTSQLRVYVASAKYPTMCTSQAMCSSDRTCMNGFCQLPFGASCQSDEDCLTGRCATPVASSICTQACSASQACPSGADCVSGDCVPSGAMPGSDGGVPDCTADNSCPPDAGSETGGKSGCIFAGGPPSAPFALLFFGLIFRRRRR